MTEPETAPANQQLPLIEADDLDDCQKELSPEIEPSYTGARVLREKPHKYQLVIELLAQGHSQIKIARMVGMTTRTVAAIMQANPEPITQARAKMMRRLQSVGSLALDGIAEDLEDPNTRRKISTRDKAVIFGVLNDHSLKMSGEPNEIRATVQAKPQHAALAAFADKMRSVEGAETSPAPYTPEMGNGLSLTAAKGQASDLPGSDTTSNKQSDVEDQDAQ